MILRATAIRMLITASLVLVEVIADKIVASQSVLPVKICVILDNGVHGLIAALSWLIVIDYRQNLPFPGIFEVLICACLASVIDIDHFIAAKSMSLNDAMHLTKRPLFHSTSLLLLVWIMLLLISTLTRWNLIRFSWIFLTAGLSHHLRDGIRRGLWFYPFGSTNPLPYWSYILATAMLPHAIRSCVNYKSVPLSVINNSLPFDFV